MAFRGCIPDFQLANPLYVGASVTFVTVLPNGTPATTLADLFCDPTSSTPARNPQMLDSEGKFFAPVYIETPVIASVVGPCVASHQTGVINARGTWRGNWTADTVYFSSDFVLDPTTGILYIAALDYTSSTSVAADLAANNLVVAFNPQIAAYAVSELGAALTLTTPGTATTNANAAWDASPLAALHIAAPPVATDRNFICGLWVETNAAAQDKGRGIIITNYGQSDSLYIQNGSPGGPGQGTDSSGIAVLLQQSAVNATGIVIGTTQAGQSGVVVRQETDLVPGACLNLLLLQASAGVGGAASACQMLAIESDAANQQGIVAVLTGAGSVAAKLTNNGTVVKGLDTSGGALSYLFGGFNSGASVNASLGISFSSAGTAFTALDSTGIAFYQPLYLIGAGLTFESAVSGVSTPVLAITTEAIATGGPSVVLGSGAIPTTAISGFLYLPTCAGAPTGVPNGATGRVPIVYDTTDNKLYVHNGTWKSVTLS